MRLAIATAQLVTITLVEAGPRILGPFDEALASYYQSHLEKRGVQLKTSVGVTEVRFTGGAVRVRPRVVATHWPSH